MNGNHLANRDRGHISTHANIPDPPLAKFKQLVTKSGFW